MSALKGHSSASLDLPLGPNMRVKEGKLPAESPQLLLRVGLHENMVMQPCTNNQIRGVGCYWCVFPVITPPPPLLSCVYNSEL